MSDLYQEVADRCGVERKYVKMIGMPIMYCMRAFQPGPGELKDQLIDHVEMSIRLGFIPLTEDGLFARTAFRYEGSDLIFSIATDDRASSYGSTRRVMFQEIVADPELKVRHEEWQAKIQRRKMGDQG